MTRRFWLCKRTEHVCVPSELRLQQTVVHARPRAYLITYPAFTCRQRQRIRYAQNRRQAGAAGRPRRPARRAPRPGGRGRGAAPPLRSRSPQRGSGVESCNFVTDTLSLSRTSNRKRIVRVRGRDTRHDSTHDSRDTHRDSAGCDLHVRSSTRAATLDSTRCGAFGTASATGSRKVPRVLS